MNIFSNEGISFRREKLILTYSTREFIHQSVDKSLAQPVRLSDLSVGRPPQYDLSTNHSLVLRTTTILQ